MVGLETLETLEMVAKAVVAVMAVMAEILSITCGHAVVITAPLYMAAAGLAALIFLVTAIRAIPAVVATPEVQLRHWAIIFPAVTPVMAEQVEREGLAVIQALLAALVFGIVVGLPALVVVMAPQALEETLLLAIVITAALVELAGLVAEGPDRTVQGLQPIAILEPLVAPAEVAEGDALTLLAVALQILAALRVHLFLEPPGEVVVAGMHQPRILAVAAVVAQAPVLRVTQEIAAT